MKRIIGILLTGIVFFSLACKGSNDVLAVYDGGTILRGDFYQWLENKRINKESILKNRELQKKRIEMMALERFMIELAKQDGLEKSEDYLEKVEMAEKSKLMNILYKKEIKDKSNFEVPAVRLQQILLKVKDYKIENNKRKKLDPKERKAEMASVSLKAKELIARLDKGEKFKDLAKEYSDDFSKKKGGDVGFVTRDLLPPYLRDTVFALKKGQYSKEPVMAGHGIYIVKVTDKKTITDRNIEKIINNKMKASRLKSRFYGEYSRNYVKKLMDAKDAEFYHDKINSLNRKEVIFKIADKQCTVADLEVHIKKYKARFPANRPAPKITPDRRKTLAENYFKYELLKRDAINKGIDKDPDYIKELNNQKGTILAQLYMARITSKIGKITESDIRIEYEKNKEKRYYRMKRVGKKQQKVVMPYNKARARVKKVLESKIKNEKIEKWKKQILADKKFHINENKLEGKAGNPKRRPVRKKIKNK